MTITYQFPVLVIQFTSMDLDFIETEHRQNVMKVMEICGLDMQQAYQLYMNSNCSVDAAVNTQFGVMSDPSTKPKDNVPVQHFQEGGFEEDPGMYQDYQQQPDQKYTQFKKFLASGRTFQKKYPIRRSEGFMKSLIPKFLKSDDEEQFKKQLESLVGRTTKLKVAKGSLSETMQWSWKQKFPVLVVALDLQPQHKALYREIFADETMVELLFNQQFRVFGLNNREYDLQPELKQVINLEKDKNTMIVLRVNCLDEVEVRGRVPISASKDQIKKKLKKIKSQCIQHELQDSQIHKQYTEELRGNFDYQRPKNIKENIKMREDRKLRRQQEEQFFKACQPKQEEVKPAPPKKAETAKPSEKKEEIKPPTQVKNKNSTEVLKERETKHAALPKYESGVQFKIRVPSGENFIITVGEQERIKYIFDWIGSHPGDLGFSQSLDRQFDIFMGFGGSETLKGKEEKRIGDIFEGSQVLIVREI